MKIAGHDFRQLRVQGAEVRSTIARLQRESGSKRIYLQKEGGHMIRGIPLGHAPAVDLADLGDAAPYVIIVEEKGAGRATP